MPGIPNAGLVLVIIGLVLPIAYGIFVFSLVGLMRGGRKQVQPVNGADLRREIDEFVARLHSAFTSR
jgi:hypothetical protein